MQRLIASWFGSGLLLRRLGRADRGSGTIGAFVALVIAIAVGGQRWPWQLALVVTVTILSLWSSRPFASDNADPGWVVVDEAAGTFLAVVGLSLVPALIAFVVFRVADITKRFPLVANAEQLPGAIGITADDLVAGAWALAVGWAAELLLFR